MIGPDDVSLLLLASISVAYSVSVRRLERLRRPLANGKMPDLLSVWTVAGTLLLPPLHIAILVIIVYATEWPARKLVGHQPLKYLYSCAAAVTSCLVAKIVVQAVDAPAGILLVVLTVSAVNITLIAIVMVLARETQILRKFANAKAHLAELSTQFLGVALAELIGWHVVLGVLVLPAVLLVHRWSLRETVKAEEAFDEATGLWSETAWRVQAHQKLHDARGHVALLMIDPDEAGQERQIMQSIESGLGPSDLLGRYGTRQIVVLISVGRAEAGRYLSTGFRTDLARAAVPAEMGFATTADSELEALLIEAMSDLMARRAAAGVHRSW
jgi:hypothetical protein